MELDSGDFQRVEQAKKGKTNRKCELHPLDGKKKKR
jgi:hypothetical protein